MRMALPFLVTLRRAAIQRFAERLSLGVIRSDDAAQRRARALAADSAQGEDERAADPAVAFT